MTPEAEALILALRSGADCRRSQVGALVVRDGRVVGRGWNGLRGLSCRGGDCPRGLLTYDEIPAGSTYESNCEALHAEEAAIREAGELAVGATIYTTRAPCYKCEAAIADARLAETVVIDSANSSLPGRSEA